MELFRGNAPKHLDAKVIRKGEGLVLQRRYRQTGLASPIDISYKSGRTPKLFLRGQHVESQLECRCLRKSQCAYHSNTSTNRTATSERDHGYALAGEGHVRSGTLRDRCEFCHILSRKAGGSGGFKRQPGKGVCGTRMTGREKSQCPTTMVAEVDCLQELTERESRVRPASCCDRSGTRQWAWRRSYGGVGGTGRSHLGFHALRSDRQEGVVSFARNFALSVNSD